MKKSLLSLLAATAGLSAFAQIPNAGFELLNPEGITANWDKIIVQPFPCSVSEGYDSVYFRATDAHSGSYALEIRNAHCDASVFAGGINLREDNGDPYSFGSGVPFAAAPPSIGFFYKFFPVDGDRMHITISLQDDTTGETIADADQTIDAASAVYTLADIPLTYYSSNAPTRLFINLRMENETGGVHYGSRFLMDDVASSPTAVAAISSYRAPAFYPNPASGTLHIAQHGVAAICRLLNLAGQCVLRATADAGGALDVRNVAPGAYLLQVTGADGNLRSGLVEIR